VLAHRQHEVAADEDVHFADFELVAHHLDGIDDNEEQVAIFLDLRPLVAMARILDRQRVQVELVLHLG